MIDLIKFSVSRSNIGCSVVCCAGYKDVIRGFFFKDGERNFCFLADHQSNVGVSLTNGFSEYSASVARFIGVGEEDIRWFYLDTIGRIDTVVMHAGTSQFYALKEKGVKDASVEAMGKRLEVLGVAPALLVQVMKEVVMLCNPSEI